MLMFLFTCVEFVVSCCFCFSWLGLHEGHCTALFKFLGSSMRRLSLRVLLLLCYVCLIRLSGFDFLFSWPGPLSGFFVCDPATWTTCWIWALAGGPTLVLLCLCA